MRAFHYIVFALVLMAGLGASVWLVPGQVDLGLMYFKDKQYAEARRIYEKRIEAGDRSVNVVMPLAEIYVQFGEVNRAVGLLQRVASNRSDQVAVTERIGKFQQYEQRPGDYLRTLEAVNRLRSSEESLRELANLYRYSNQNAKLIATLKTLAVKYPGNPADFLEVANLQAIAGRTRDAAQALEQFEAAHPQDITADTVELLLSLLLDSGQGSRALVRATRWLDRHPDPNEVARFAGLLHSKGQPALALELVSPYESLADANPALLGEWTQLQISTGHGEVALERLAGLRREKRLPDELTESIVDLALGRNNLGLALEVAEEKGLSHLPVWLLGNLADAAMAGNRAAFAQHMVATLGEGFLHGRPLLAARMALARGDREDALAQLSAVPLGGLPEAVTLEVATMYLSLGKAEDGLGRFAQLRAKNQGWALLAASCGRGREVEDWLDSRPELPQGLLRDLYFIAADKRETGPGLATARRIYGADASGGNRLLLANALIASGQPGDAVPYLRELLSAGGAGEIENTYIAALLAAVRDAKPGTVSPFVAELRGVWTAKLREPGLDAAKSLELIYGLLDLSAWEAVLPQLEGLAHRRADLLTLYIETAVKASRQSDVVAFLKNDLERTDLTREMRETRVYALIEHGGQAAALPYIRSLAASSIPAWIAAYEDALGKLGLTEELTAFWKDRAAKSDAPPAERRTIAYNLLEAGHQDFARAIFESLAQTAGPDEPDVAELLYLWGPKPGAGPLSWLAERARAASGLDQPAWLRHLVDAGGADRAAAIALASLPPPGQGGALLDVCLRALAELRETGPLAAVITREVAVLSDSGRLRVLAQTARDAGATGAAETAYLKLLALGPEDPEARHWLGIYNFGRANYAAAERYLSALLQSSEGAYDDNFYYGEMLWRKGDHAAAKEYYGRVVEVIGRMPTPPLEAAVARAQSMFRLGDVDGATRKFQELLAANPGNADLRADFGALLLENGISDRAAQVLSADAGLQGIRLALLRAQLLSAAGRKPEALTLLEDLTAANPNQVQALAGLASMEETVGRHRQAQSLLERAQFLDPGNEDLVQARTALEREQAPEAGMETTSRTIQGAQSESILRITGDVPLSASLRFHFAADQDWVTIRSLRLIDGSITAFDGVRRRVEGSLEREWENGTRLQGSLFLGGATPGAGAVLTRPDAQGSTSLRFEFRRPYWEFAETLAQSGVRDRVELRREITLGRRLSVRAGAAANRYGLAGAPDAARSVAATGGVTFQLARRPQLALEYDFDGEYRLSARSLPLTSHEVHSASLAAAKQLTGSLSANTAGGFALDRYGGRAPFLDFNLKYEPRGHFGVQLNFDRRLYFLDTARTVTIFGGRTFWRF